ncbi:MULTISPECIES: CoxG family protein [Allobacillus]|uniref:SRPBCC family protein n=1 Tax=Allobacillus salarius TaxID=1955272 RepID=A0A556PL05_9BACI|nr:SRPBCC family protein [Allobacillus salarius]TSJ65068.1 SRPBCC family protein [Allobacillus salarius]
MPQGKHNVDINVSIEEVWDFVSSINNWAPLVPGYIHHEIISDTESTWEFKGDLGFMKKTVKLKVDITEWREPTLVTFNLTGISDNFKGHGYFEATKTSDASTQVTGMLNITAGGVRGPMINRVLRNFVPATAVDLTDAVANEIVKVKKN